MPPNLSRVLNYKLREQVSVLIPSHSRRQLGARILYRRSRFPVSGTRPATWRRDVIVDGVLPPLAVRISGRGVRVVYNLTSRDEKFAVSTSPATITVHQPRAFGSYSTALRGGIEALLTRAGRKLVFRNSDDWRAAIQQPAVVSRTVIAGSRPLLPLFPPPRPRGWGRRGRGEGQNGK